MHAARTGTLLAVTLQLSLLLQACAGAGSPPTATPAPTKLKVLISRYLSYAPFFIAEAEGFFTAQNLAVELVQVSSVSSSIPALLQGEADVLSGSPSAAYFNAIGKGGRLRFVADKGYYAAGGCPTEALYARPDLVKNKTLDTPAGWRGLSIQLETSRVGGLWVDKYLRSKGVKLQDLRSLRLPEEIVSEAFSKGTLDLAWAAEPLNTRLVQDQSATLLVSAEQVVPDFQVGFVVYGPSLLDKNPDAGRRFMVAYLQAVRQYNQGKTERNLDIIEKYTGLDGAFLKQACWQPMRDSGHLNTASLMEYQSYLGDLNLIDARVTDPQQIGDTTFVEYANKALKERSK